MGMRESCNSGELSTCIPLQLFLTPRGQDTLAFVASLAGMVTQHPGSGLCPCPGWVDSASLVPWKYKKACTCSWTWERGNRWNISRQTSVSPIWLFSVCGNQEMRVWGTSRSTLESQTNGTGSCITGGEKTFQVTLIFLLARSGVSCAVCASRVVVGVKGFQD